MPSRPTALYNWRGKRLKQEEWDFRECPTRQLESCLYHELMREWDWYRWKLPTLATPWLLRPFKERERHCDDLEESPLGVFGGKLRAGKAELTDSQVRALAGTHGVCPWTVFTNWKKWRKGEGFLRIGQEFYCHFKVDLSYSNPQLVTAFEKWLKDTLRHLHNPRGGVQRRGV